MNRKSVFITGGAGFIGSNLAAHHLKIGDKVTIYDNLSRVHVEKNLEWLESIAKPDQLNIIKADIRDVISLHEAIKNHTHVFHCAGQTAVTTSIKDPQHDFEVNAQGTFNVLEAVRKNIPEAIVIYTSTNKVYGSLSHYTPILKGERYELPQMPGLSESEPLEFYSPYGCSKGTGDQYTLDYARIYGLNTIVFRQSCIYGEHQYGVEDQGWVAHFVSQAIKKQPITIFGDGFQVRDLLYIDDLITAFDKASNSSAKIKGNVYNIGGGINNSLSLKECLGYIEDILGKNLKVEFKAPRQGDQAYYVSDTQKAKQDFNWQPTTTIETGLNLLFTWLNQRI